MSPASTAALRQQALAVRHKRAKSTPKKSTIAVYASLFVLIVTVVAVGYAAPQKADSVSNSLTASFSSIPSVDDVVAANLAADIAQTANLAVSRNVAEQAATTQMKSDFARTAQASLGKPQLLEGEVENRKVVTYKVQAGDTLASIAAKYGISRDTIKWANNMTLDAVNVGSNLKILPYNGVLYTVKQGDSLKQIANKYKSDETRIVLANDLDQTGIKTGQRLILPDGILPANERPGYAPAVTTFLTGYSSGFSNGRTWHIRTGTPNRGNYAFGNCTAYAFDRRMELGSPVGSNWGNAGSWAMYGSQNGYRVDRIPSAGAVIQDSGHVAIVEEVLANGDLRISEMNAMVPGGGYNQVSGRILPAAYVKQYLYIH